MARKMVRISDQSGSVIEEGSGSIVRFGWTDGRKQNREADLTDAEAQAIADSVNARIVARRGRRPVKA